MNNLVANKNRINLLVIFVAPIIIATFITQLHYSNILSHTYFVIFGVALGICTGLIGIYKHQFNKRFSKLIASIISIPIAFVILWYIVFLIGCLNGQCI